MTERMGLAAVGRQNRQRAALARRAELRPAARRLAAVAVGFAGGWAVLYGALMPFGLGFVLGFAEDCFAPCAAGAALGVLLHGFGALSLRSVCMLCALGAAVAARWMGARTLTPAVLAGCGTLVGVALCFAFGGGGAELVLYSAADALLAAAMGFCLRQFAPEKPGAGMLLVGAAAAAALGSVQLWQLLPGVIVCAALELYLCSKGQAKAALAACAVLGAALCAADPALSFAASGLACATVAAAVLAPGRRMETVAAYAGGCVTGALCVQPPGSAFQYLLNVCIGITAVAAMPAAWLVPEPEEKPQAGQAQPQQYSAAATRLEQVSQSLASLAETVNDVYETLPHRCEDFHWVIDNTHDTLCFNCGRRDTCWKQEYAATLEGMEALRPLLESSGGLETAQLPGQLSRCIHPAALCAAANRSFALYRSRKEARLHAEAMRTALTEQYSAVAEALGVLGEQLGRPGDPEPYKSGRVADFFAQLGTPPQECAVTLDDLGRCHHSTKIGCFTCMLQQVLTIRRTIFHLTDDTDQFRMQTVDTQVDGCTFTGFDNFFFHLFANFSHHFLDTSRMDTSVGHKLMQCQTGNFTANRVEGRKNDSFRSVVNNDFNAGSGFQSTDVTSFTSDNTSFDFI